MLQPKSTVLFTFILFQVITCLSIKTNINQLSIPNFLESLKALLSECSLKDKGVESFVALLASERQIFFDTYSGLMESEGRQLELLNFFPQPLLRKWLFSLKKVSCNPILAVRILTKENIGSTILLTVDEGLSMNLFPFKLRMELLKFMEESIALNIYSYNWQSTMFVGLKLEEALELLFQSWNLQLPYNITKFLLGLKKPSMVAERISTFILSGNNDDDDHLSILRVIKFTLAISCFDCESLMALAVTVIEKFCSKFSSIGISISLSRIYTAISAQDRVSSLLYIWKTVYRIYNLPSKELALLSLDLLIDLVTTVLAIDHEIRASILWDCMDRLARIISEQKVYPVKILKLCEAVKGTGYIRLMSSLKCSN